MLFKIVKKVVTTLSLESLVRLSARLTAAVVFYSMSQVKDPRIAIGVTAIVKTSNVVAKKYKRTNFEPTSIFEDSVDGVTDAF